MKRLWKKWWFYAGLVVILGSAGGWWGYYSVTHQDVTAEELGLEENFFDFSSLNQPVAPGATPGEGAADSAARDPLAEEREAGSDSQPDAATSSRPTSATPAPAAGSHAPAEPAGTAALQSSIEARYIPQIKALESLAVSRLEQLFAAGLQEYEQSRETGSPSMAKLAQKYTSAAAKLQGSVDQTFQSLTRQMEQELKDNHLPIDTVTQMRQEYKERIQAKKQEFFARVSR